MLSTYRDLISALWDLYVFYPSFIHSFIIIISILHRTALVPMWVESKCKVNLDLCTSEGTISEFWCQVSWNLLFVKSGDVKKFKLDWYILVKYDPTDNEDSDGFKVPVCNLISGISMVLSLTVNSLTISGP